MKNIILTGFMGTGKSSVGRLLAKELNLRFVDTDALIEREARLNITQIFERFGEAYFRDIEKRIIKNCLQEENWVVAAGGGAIVDKENLMLMKASGFVVCLTASVDVILSRVCRNNERPLLNQTDKRAVIEKLLEYRKPFYEKADLCVDTTNKTVKEVVEEIKGRLKPMEQITVNLGERSYPIYFTRGGLDDIGKLMRNAGLAGKVSIITNAKVNNLHGRDVVLNLKKAGFAPNVIEIPDGEEYKNLKTISFIYDSLISHKMERASPLVAFGGGIVGDITGFASATYLRGVPFVQVPTTLLSQVDSSVGGKTGVNHPMGKNLIGAFYQPRLVLIDSNVLKTLPTQEIKAGLAEVIKYGVIRDKDLFAFLEKDSNGILNLGEGIDYAIKRSCEIKAEIVEVDEKEKGLRTVLNFGHTFGHAIESLTHYKQFKHGEAVAIGMVMAAGLSYKMGLCSQDVYKRIISIVKQFGLPILPPRVDAQEFIVAMETDKKVVDERLKFILVKDIGDVMFYETEKKGFQKILWDILQMN